ncbi:MAG: hypothetical protein U5K30_11015 [Acidimicrobiales bacterium]|nr:hypothetical protein [Acidimicrobiales bacterium]
MTKVIDTVTEYETKALDAVSKVQDEVLSYLKQVVDFVDGRISEIDLPFDFPEIEALDEVPTLQEIVDTQFAFSKKILANQEKFAKNIVKTVKPITPEPVKASTATKSTSKSTKATKSTAKSTAKSSSTSAA